MNNIDPSGFSTINAEGNCIYYVDIGQIVCTKSGDPKDIQPDEKQCDKPPVIVPNKNIVIPPKNITPRDGTTVGGGVRGKLTLSK